MANLYTHKDSNIRKTWFLMTMFLVMVIFLGWLFSTVWQMPEIFYFAVGLSFIMNFSAYWFSDNREPVHHRRASGAEDIYNSRPADKRFRYRPQSQTCSRGGYRRGVNQT